MRPLGRVVLSADREHSHCIPSNDGYSNGCPCQRFGVGIASGEGVCSRAAFAPVPSFSAFFNKHVRAGPCKAAWAHHERGSDAGSCYHVCSGGRRDCKGTHLTATSWISLHHQASVENVQPLIPDTLGMSRLWQCCTISVWGFGSCVMRRFLGIQWRLCSLLLLCTCARPADCMPRTRPAWSSKPQAWGPWTTSES